MICCDAMNSFIATQPKPADWAFCPFCGMTTVEDLNSVLEDTDEWTDDGDERVLAAGCYEAHIDSTGISISFDSTGEKETDDKIAFSVLQFIEKQCAAVSHRINSMEESNGQ